MKLYVISIISVLIVSPFVRAEPDEIETSTGMSPEKETFLYKGTRDVVLERSLEAKFENVSESDFQVLRQHLRHRSPYVRGTAARLLSRIEFKESKNLIDFAVDLTIARATIDFDPMPMERLKAFYELARDYFSADLQRAGKVVGDFGYAVKVDGVQLEDYPTDEFRRPFREELSKRLRKPVKTAGDADDAILAIRLAGHLEMDDIGTQRKIVDLVKVTPAQIRVSRHPEASRIQEASVKRLGDRANSALLDMGLSPELVPAIQQIPDPKRRVELLIASKPSRARTKALVQEVVEVRAPEKLGRIFTALDKAELKRSDLKNLRSAFNNLEVRSSVPGGADRMLNEVFANIPFGRDTGTPRGYAHLLELHQLDPAVSNEVMISIINYRKTLSLPKRKELDRLVSPTLTKILSRGQDSLQRAGQAVLALQVTQELEYIPDELERYALKALDPSSKIQGSPYHVRRLSEEAHIALLKVTQSRPVTEAALLRIAEDFPVLRADGSIDLARSNIALSIMGNSDPSHPVVQDTALRLLEGDFAAPGIETSQVAAVLNLERAELTPENQTRLRKVLEDGPQLRDHLERNHRALMHRIRMVPLAQPDVNLQRIQLAEEVLRVNPGDWPLVFRILEDGSLNEEGNLYYRVGDDYSRAKNQKKRIALRRRTGKVLSPSLAFYLEGKFYDKREGFDRESLDLVLDSIRELEVQDERAMKAVGSLLPEQTRKMTLGFGKTFDEFKFEGESMEKALRALSNTVFHDEQTQVRLVRAIADPHLGVSQGAIKLVDGMVANGTINSPAALKELPVVLGKKRVRKTLETMSVGAGFLRNHDSIPEPGFARRCIQGVVKRLPWWKKRFD